MCDEGITTTTTWPSSLNPKPLPIGAPPFFLCKSYPKEKT
jgi:hypothetical protein